MTQIKLRRGTAAQWTTANPVLGDGEPGFERDTGKLKVGDGVTHWATLAYLTGSGGGAALPATQQSVRGAITGLTNGAFVDFTALGGSPRGDNLLNFAPATFNTAPGDSPAFIAEGHYSILIDVGPDNGAHVGKYQTIALTTHASGVAGNPVVYETTPLNTAPGGVGPIGWLSLVWYFEVDDYFQLIVNHDIGVATDYDVNLFVQRIS